jgi:hypothetical protein
MEDNKEILFIKDFSQKEIDQNLIFEFIFNKNIN